MKPGLRFQRRAFVNHELLFAIALLSIAVIIVMPIADRLHWPPLLAIGAVFATYGLVVVLLNFQNIKEDFLTWKNKK